MVQNPDIQKKAQMAIDNALGGHRLPEFSDAGSIPYIDAIVMEVLRWRPVVPLGMCTIIFPVLIDIPRCSASGDAR